MQHQVIGTQPQDAGRRLFAPFRRAFSVTDSAKRNFIIQLGFEEPAATDIARQYSALTFQPRIVLIAIIVGMLFQSRAGFAALGALLWWSALFPELSLFNALYNQTLGRWPGRFRLTPSPAPRRAAETEAGTIALTIALLLNAGFGFAAYMVEGILLAAAVAVRLGGFCTGSFIYHVVRGEWKFALRTLPWAGYIFPRNGNSDPSRRDGGGWPAHRIQERDLRTQNSSGAWGKNLRGMDIVSGSVLIETLTRPPNRDFESEGGRRRSV